ncbi:MAG: hypothetical protein K940chlam1_00369 [Candidatus Anoxychlamydiales bacterium]|nr:hypothetical protein [Candidatus Anoxychlamydiales bacterium]
MHQILLFCLLAIQFLYIAIIRIDPLVRDKIFIPLMVSSLAFFFAPIQGGLSDYYCRKKSLLFALLIVLIASIFFVFWFVWHKQVYLFIYIFMLGIAGNVAPIALSAFKDITRKFTNFRFFICLALFYYFIGDFGHLVSKYFASSKTILETGFFFIIGCIILVFLIFKDAKDRELPEQRPSIIEQIKYIYHNFLENKVFMIGLIGFLFLEVSLYQFSFRTEVFDGFLSRVAPLQMILGAMLGLAFLKFSKMKDENIFIFALIGSFICYLVLFLANFFDFITRPYSMGLLLFFGFNYSLLYSSLYCLFTRKRHHHDHGKIFGLLDSIDSISYVVAIIIVFVIRKVPMQTIWLISLVLLGVGGLFFYRFLKYDKDIPHIK